MKKKNNPIASRFRAVRKELGFTQQQLADELLMSRNYIAKIEAGIQQPGDRVMPALESLRVRLSNNRRADSVDRFTPVSEARAAYGDIPDIVAEIERHHVAVLAAAGRDPVRLGWIREQQRAHLAIPAHWDESSPRPPKQSAISEMADELDRQHQANFKRARSDPAFHALHAGKK